MKKIAALALYLMLMISLIGCKKYSDIGSNETDYSISYELGGLTDVFICTPTSARYLDSVEIRTQILFDADIHIYVDGLEIEKSHYGSDYWGYSFTMPKNDVLVTAKPFTKNEIWGVE